MAPIADVTPEIQVKSVATVPEETRMVQQDKPVKKQANKDLQKTRLCVYHLEGKCGYGANCTFAHRANEIRGVPDLRKTQLCQKFMEGNCNDENCTYAHGTEELRDSPNFKMKMCKWSSKGQCRNGTKCGFAHSIKELRGYNKPPPGIEVSADSKIGPPPGLESIKPEVDPLWEVSTQASSSDVSNNVVTPDLQLFQFQAARGAAPLKQQVSMMSSAVSALQAKLSTLENMVLQTQATQMQQSIQQLNEQCRALEAGLATTELPKEATQYRLNLAEATKSRLSSKATPFVPLFPSSLSDDSTSVGSD